MANQIADGNTLLGPNQLRGLTGGDLASLRQELDKLQREARAVVPAQDDALASQARNRRIGRIGSALQVLSHKMTSKR